MKMCAGDLKRTKTGPSTPKTVENGCCGLKNGCSGLRTDSGSRKRKLVTRDTTQTQDQAQGALKGVLTVFMMWQVIWVES